MSNLHCAHRNAIEELLGQKNGPGPILDIPDVITIQESHQAGSKCYRVALSSVSVNHKFGADNRTVAIFRRSRRSKVRGAVHVNMAVLVEPKDRKNFKVTKIVPRDSTHQDLFRRTNKRMNFPSLITDRF
ncbi:MAG: hypothetical protein A3H57_00760 [Candidatus Taylorbacteria bacterium RIFCSPLOWO2_02_FULL_43_11]|uniref:Uncharacterized protein n=1 Tax=Candidatus Taylorbacteria bacterium RIFCSPHIGHO2_02_FULL_43_32b TaxID=1802306 RepID=A0A1G2MHQ1_9BACT|nr:MAG: hypothetical protein A2743_00785 [Candidatus Taylorbacteria bacterium RIFCSPHIGHO2_01_FULL_43_47]OHA23426.1 MAG: hypothetical protein A3C72_00460 [Candidatus Taylorbacteria bacterium RIFCSPHIGHO2_02_FULL_43_32b]OHA30420.1 MAG: hypothetical protein A3B08_02765 [Candidatus Taylorbacteria bacterium RIFCSPLOWO2_01_FULL_43_44]OHA36967.1 MAG: hypothetical protein A3H57_00760 [Candidatus Taylorbacteria bacterium RIFCSPLOWO2_02_FULL_43_11]